MWSECAACANHFSSRRKEETAEKGSDDMLKPDFYRLACRVAIGDLVEAGGEVFLNAASVAAS
jgi:hypothetical protein